MRLSCHFGHVRMISAESQEIGWPVSLQCSASANFLVSHFLIAFLCLPSPVANCLAYLFLLFITRQCVRTFFFIYFRFFCVFGCPRFYVNDEGTRLVKFYDCILSYNIKSYIEHLKSTWFSKGKKTIKWFNWNIRDHLKN